jgi:hypothetical protein
MGGGESIEVQAWRNAGFADANGGVHRPPQDPALVARTVLKICTATYEQAEVPDPRYDVVHGRELRFHRRCMILARMFMGEAGLPPEADWRDHVWFTDLVKCSTTVDEESATVPCVRQCLYLRDELEVLRPQVIVALTRSVERTLRRLFPHWSSRVVYARVFRTGFAHSSDERLRSEVRGLVRI